MGHLDLENLGNTGTGLQNEELKCHIQLGFQFTLVFKGTLASCKLNLDRTASLNSVNCQSFGQEPRKDETPDMMELAKKYQAKMRKAKREQAESTILLPARLL